MKDELLTLIVGSGIVSLFALSIILIEIRSQNRKLKITEEALTIACNTHCEDFLPDQQSPWHSGADGYRAWLLFQAEKILKEERKIL
jgi:hypothetical protein